MFSTNCVTCQTLGYNIFVKILTSAYYKNKLYINE